MKIMKPILAFAVCLWAVAVVTYASQAQNGEAHKKALESVKTGESADCSGAGGPPGGGE